MLEGGFLPSQVQDLEPRELRRVANGVRYRNLRAYDLAAFFVVELMNSRMGWGMRKGQRMTVRKLLGRPNASAILYSETEGPQSVKDKKQDESAKLKARAERIEARHKAARERKKKKGKA